MLKLFGLVIARSVPWPRPVRCRTGSGPPGQEGPDNGVSRAGLATSCGGALRKAGDAGGLARGRGQPANHAARTSMMAMTQ